MKPALSIILFTTIAGAAQGAVVVLALATLAGVAPTASLAPMLWAVTGMLLVALVASFFHLGHPLRAARQQADDGFHAEVAGVAHAHGHGQINNIGARQKLT